MDLSRRFETPNAKQRWDKPLFKVMPAMAEGEEIMEEEYEGFYVSRDGRVPCSMVLDALMSKKLEPSVNMSTIPVSGNHIYRPLTRWLMALILTLPFLFDTPSNGYWILDFCTSWIECVRILKTLCLKLSLPQ
jgi:hypothetical protein